MSMSLPELVGVLRLDDSQFNAAINAAPQTLQRLSQQGSQTARTAGQNMGNNLTSALMAAMSRGDLEAEVRRQMTALETQARTTGVAAGDHLSQGIEQGIQSSGGAQALGQLGEQGGRQAGAGVDVGIQYGILRAFSNLIPLADQMGGGAGEALQQGIREGLAQGLDQGADGAAQTGARVGDRIGDAAQPAIEQGIQQGVDQGGAQAGQAGAQAGQTFGDQFGDMLGSVIAGLGIGAMINAAIGDEDSTALLKAQLDLTTEEAARAGKLAGQIYAQNYGESVDEIKDVMREIGASIGDLSNMTDERLAEISAKAVNTAKITGEESGRIVQQVGRLIRTGLARDATEAFDLITKASQGMSGQVQGAMLDVVDEYSQHFAAIGISGAQAFGLVKESAKDGEIALDKVGDAVKEFAIRATDMSTTSVAAYETLGLSASDMANRILAGGGSAQAAFTMIMDGLRSIEDPATQANTAIALFGTPLEDLGVSKVPAFVGALSDATGGLGDFKGAADEVDATLSGTTSATLSGWTRGLETAGTAISRDFLPAMEPLIDGVGWLVGVLGQAVGLFGKLPASIKLAVLAFGTYVALRGPITALTTAMRNSVTAGGGMTGMLGKLKTAAGMGAAFVGIGLIVDSFNKTMADNAAAVANAKQRQDDLAAALVASKGAWDDNVRAMLEASVVNDDFFKALRGAGLDYSTTMKALTGDTTAYGTAMVKLSENGDDASAMLMAQLKAYKDNQAAAEVSAAEQMKFAQETELAKGALGRMNAETDEGTAKLMVHTGYAKDMTDAYQKMGKEAPDAIEKTADAAADYVHSADEMRAATEANATKMADAISVLAGEFEDLSSRVDDSVDALDKWAGRAPDLEQATSDLNAEIDEMAAKFDTAQEGVQVLGSGILKASGEIKTGTDKGREFRDSLIDLRDKTVAASQAAADNALVTGGTLAQAQEAAAAKAKLGYDAFIQTATAILGSKEAAERAAAAYGLIPEQIATTVTAETAAAEMTIAEFINRRRVIEIQTQINNTGVLGGTAAGRQTKAGGGPITGQGTKGVDSELILAAPGEHMMTAREVDALGGHANAYRLRQAILNGTLPRFAAGGAVGTLDLSGRSAPTYGTREGNVRGALAELVQIIQSASDAARQARSDSGARQNDWRDARVSARNVSKDQAERVAAAQERLSEARKAAAALDDKATKQQKESAAKRVADAVKNLEKTQAAQAKANAAEARKVALAEKAMKQADATAQAATRNVRLAKAEYEAQERNRRALVRYARLLDSTSEKYDAARSKLEQLRGAADGLASSIADGLRGTDGGLTGYSAQRTTVASILRGREYTRDNVRDFEKDLKRLEKLGLSSKQLQELALQGVTGGGMTADVLAGATRAQIKQLNAYDAQISSSASRTGRFVATDAYGEVISRQQKVVKDLSGDIKTLVKRLEKIDDKISDAMGDELSRWRPVQDPQGVWRMAKKGEQMAKRSK